MPSIKVQGAILRIIKANTHKGISLREIQQKTGVPRKTVNIVLAELRDPAYRQVRICGYRKGANVRFPLFCVGSEPDAGLPVGTQPKIR